METLVKKLRKESQVQVLDKVGRFQGIESEIHYRMMNPKLNVPVSLAEEFRKESVMMFEIDAPQELSEKEKNLLQQIESEFNAQSVIASIQAPKQASLPENVKKTIREKVTKNKVAQKPITNNNNKKKEEKEEKPKIHRKLVFSKETVSLMEGKDLLSSYENKNKVNPGELIQGNQYNMKLKNKEVKGTVRTMFFDTHSQQLVVQLKEEGTDKIVWTRLNSILGF